MPDNTYESLLEEVQGKLIAFGGGKYFEELGLGEGLHSFYVVPSCGACDYCDMPIENSVYVEPAVQIERQ